MLFPIQQLLENRPAPMTVPLTTTVRDALKLMMKYNISHLPVVEEDGDLLGIISNKTITQAYYLLGGQVPLLELTVDHCLMHVDPLTPEDDLFEACDKLRDSDSAIVVVDNRKPVGILTGKDLTQFFRHRSEDILRTEDIELTLRLRTRDAFSDDESMNRALLVALGPDPQDPTKPVKEYEALTLGDLLRVMAHEENWPHFDGMFEPLELFTMLMDRVRRVRNMLAHFRGETDRVQESTLRYALDWLSTRARSPLSEADGPKRATVLEADIPLRTGESRWNPLRDWLKSQQKAPEGIVVTFHDIEKLVGGMLPSSAKRHPIWWSNNANEAQCAAWLSAGWGVARVDLGKRQVIFQPLSVNGAVKTQATADGAVRSI